MCSSCEADLHLCFLTGKYLVTQHHDMAHIFSIVGIEEGVDHLANAVVICGQPQQLIQVFSQTLPPPVVQLLMLKIPVVKQVCTSQYICDMWTATAADPGLQSDLTPTCGTAAYAESNQ